VIENEETTLEVAHFLKNITEELDIPLIFKSSYDKANRTSVDSFRGPGIVDGLKIIQKVKQETGLPVLSDVHSCNEIKEAAEVLDVIQIPAFLSRQTDLLVKAGETGLPINIKKGQFVSPVDFKQAVMKVLSTENRNLLLTERGTFFGYNNLVVDFRSIPTMKSFGFPVVFDATHSVQLPGGSGTSSGGQREYAEYLARSAVAAGANGVFLEIHPEPDKALCDGPNSLPLEKVKPLLTLLKDIHSLVN
jgi:2-dehydro-3-deoxyphosphooctonate aldolase (KDO 8-P synthase)